jgi:general secretion pathway protein D
MVYKIMIKKIYLATFFLFGLWATFLYSSQPTRALAEMSFVDTSVTDLSNNMLMNSVVTPSDILQKTSDISKENLFFESIEDKKSHTLYQPDVLNNQDIFLNFEDADLSSVATYIENIHNVTFVTDDVVTSTTSTTATGTGLQGHKVSFRMFKSINKRQSWNLFITFLKMAGLDLVPMIQPGFYKIVSFASALNEALPTYIGVDPEMLPQNDMMVRYIYFLQNSDPATVQTLVSQLQGSTGKLEIYTDMKALIFIDKAQNIRSLMSIVIEMDRAVSPQAVSVIKLQRALAADVITLYNSLKPTDSSSSDRAWDPVKKQSSLQYFPSDVILTADARTNSLILLGTRDGVTRVEDFIKKHVDEEIMYRESPVYVYHLEYTNSTDIKTILSSVISYGSGTTTATYGGTLNGEQYFSPMTIVADEKTNSLIINSTQKDYISLEKLIKQLDVPQKQVAFDILLLQVTDIDTRTLGAQIAGSTNSDGTAKVSTFLNSVSAQTSGVPSGTSVVSNGGNLKASLASLITGTSSIVNTAGSTLVTFGESIWGLLKIVKSLGTTQIIANPFLVTTNNTAGNVQMGITRQVKTSDVFTSSSTAVTSGYTSLTASLNITITPQVNENNMMSLDLNIVNNDFTVASASDTNSANTNNKSIVTSATIASGEVLVLGGIVKENISSAGSGVPFLEKIPVFGWLFKSRTRSITKDHFVVFIAPRVIDPLNDGTLIEDYTQRKIEEAQTYLGFMNDLEMSSVQKDPISRGFFSVENPTGIALFEENVTAYKESLSERNALMNRVTANIKEVETAQTSKKNRKAARAKAKKNNQASKHSKKKKRRANKFSQINSLDSSTMSSTKNLATAESVDTFGDDTEFIQDAFPLAADELEVTSIYDAINSTQGVKNA